MRYQNVGKSWFLCHKSQKVQPFSPKPRVFGQNSLVVLGWFFWGSLKSWLLSSLKPPREKGGAESLTFGAPSGGIPGESLGAIFRAWRWKQIEKQNIHSSWWNNVVQPDEIVGFCFSFGPCFFCKSCQWHCNSPMIRLMEEILHHLVVKTL